MHPSQVIRDKKMPRKLTRETFDIAFKARLRLARIGAGMSQSEVAKELNLLQNTYSRYENRGKSILPTHLIAKFCIATNCDLWFLLAGKTLPKPK